MSILQTTYCPNCGDEDSLDTDENGQLYCTACDYDIEEDDDTSNPPDRDPIPVDEPYDSLLAQMELAELDDNCPWENDYDDSF